MAVGSVLAVADLLTGLAIEPRRAGLVAVESGPAGPAGAFSRHGVAAVRVLDVARAQLVTADAIEPIICTQPGLTPLSGVARLTEARPADVVALSTILALARFGTLHSIKTDWALILAPFSRVAGAAATLPCR